MKKYLFILFALIFSAFTLIQQGWSKLGDVTISSQLDNESIMVSGNEKYQWIKFKAANQPFQLLNLDLYYASGEVQNVNARTSIDAGLESKKFDLKAGQVLKKVIIYYKLFPGKHNDNVVVELYGAK